MTTGWLPPAARRLTPLRRLARNIPRFLVVVDRLPSSVAIVVLGALKHMVLEARWECLRRDLWRAYRSGRQARPLLAVFWERHLHEPLDDVRRRLSVAPLRG